MFSIYASKADIILNLKSEIKDKGWEDMIKKYIKDGKRSRTNYVFTEGLIIYKSRIWVPKDSNVTLKIMEILHGSVLGGHTGIDRTSKRIKTSFWWEGMSVQIKEYVSTCLTCQQMKNENIKKYGLLLPLPIPEAVSQDISVDFITSLPIIRGKSVIIVVVDRLSKFVHLGALPSTYTSTSVAEYFINNIIKLHGFLRSIVSERDKVFTGKFWGKLRRQNGCKLAVFCLPSTIGRANRNSK